MEYYVMLSLSVIFLKVIKIKNIVYIWVVFILYIYIGDCLLFVLIKNSYF